MNENSFFHFNNNELRSLDSREKNTTVKNRSLTEIRILSTNPRSVANKLESLNHYFDDLDLDVALLSETCIGQNSAQDSGQYSHLL